MTETTFQEFAHEARETAPLYSEPATAKVAYSLIWIIFASLFINIVLVSSCIYLFVRKPERIVIQADAKGEQLLMVDDRNFGSIKNLTIEPDRPTNAQKILLAKNFAALLFEVDQSTRQKAIKKALGVMPSGSANALFQYLKNNTSNSKNEAGVALTTERSENWAATFETKEAFLDSNNPNVVTILGTQKITKVIGGTPTDDERNLQLQIQVHPDANGRQDYNEQLGFQVLSYTMKELPK